MGSCPSEALTLESFDPNTFTQSFEHRDETLISCKKDTACLGSFDAYHFATMALNHENNPICDLRHCESCALNKDHKVSTFIASQIDRANRFLQNVDGDARVLIADEPIGESEQEPERRMVFKKAVNTLAQSSEQKPFVSLTMERRQDKATALPMKYELLKTSLTQKIDKMAKTSITMEDALFFDKSIDFDACTNCRECAQFCPTHALNTTPDSQGIMFEQGLCIGCGICEAICKTDAVSTQEGFDLIEIAYKRSKTLVYYEMVKCHECRTPFPYKGGDPICDRCTDFLSHSADLFTLARDL